MPLASSSVAGHRAPVTSRGTSTGSAPGRRTASLGGVDHGAGPARGTGRWDASVPRCDAVDDRRTVRGRTGPPPHGIFISYDRKAGRGVSAQVFEQALRGLPRKSDASTSVWLARVRPA